MDRIVYFLLILFLLVCLGIAVAELDQARAELADAKKAINQVDRVVDMLLKKLAKEGR